VIVCLPFDIFTLNKGVTMPDSAKLITLSDVEKALPPRGSYSQKGDFGHVVIIGGDYGFAGAARMAAEAAARVGAGLTSVATHAEHVAVICGERPEIMVHGVSSAAELKPLLAKASVLIVGPGLGQSAWSQELWYAALATDLPIVLDADGLNLLAKNPQQNQRWVLTPHPGEAARLLKSTVANIQANRLHAVELLQQTYSGVCILKGAGTLVLGEDGVTNICSRGNPGMATGGMGDVLSGVIGGLLAQGLSLETAARVGVYIHAQAGDQAALEAGQRGILALDLMPYLHRLVNP
jgi:hydroxyethylthiazole kinase-like uncharacterized protein yjeF